MSIKSKTLAPGIVVYRSEIEELSSVIDLVDSALDGRLLENKIFSAPYRSGVEDSFIFLSHLSGSLLATATREDTSGFDYDLSIKVQNVFYKVFEDYLAKSKETRMLMPYIDFENPVRGNSNWDTPDMSLIKHEKVSAPESESEPEPWSYRLGWHTDSVSSNLDAGWKHSITANLYLNDDYHGGMINFLYGNTIDNIYNKDNLKILSYKPLAGDIILYPSMWPVAHSVSFSGIEDRYLISSILRYNYDGSMKDELDRFVMPYETSLLGYADLVEEGNVSYIDGKDLWG